MSPRPSLSLAALALAGLVVACAADPEPDPQPAAQTLTASAASHGHELLPNLHHLSPNVYSGGLPAGDPAFAELARLGVRTVISVDGATPDVEGARAHGLRYVHLPITYAEVSDLERLKLARAIHDLPGPVYVHCHHGKHRAPAAAAAAAVALGIISGEEGVEYMRAAGTAPDYQGLYACVRAARVASDAELAAAPAEFPPLERPRGLRGAMVQCDTAWEHVGAIRAAGWKVPADHPDLVPVAEAGILADSLRVGAEETAAEPATARRAHDDLLARLRRAAAEAAALEQALLDGETPAQLEARYAPVAASCKDCHAEHRDRR